jgi:hypothetical protein
MAWTHSSIELTVSQYGHLQPRKGHDWINSLPCLSSENLQQACNNAENTRNQAIGSLVRFPISDNDFPALDGAGDGDRTRDVQLGKLHIDCKHNNLAFTARIFDACNFLSFHRLAPALP